MVNFRLQQAQVRMHDLALLLDVLIILAVAVVVVIIFHRLKLPSVAGFISSGLLVGPHGLGLINDPHQVEVLAEIGVALLLFGIGLELPLSKLKRLWRLAAVGGLLQVVITASLAFAVSKGFGLATESAVIVGFIMALSSTAIVLRGLQERGEVDAPHGRLILGILVFQDFSVIPMMLILPLLMGTDLSAGIFTIALLKSLGIVVAVLLSAIIIVPRILRLVALTRQHQLFMLAVFVVCLGTAWLVTRSGASLAIGAFLAGLVVAGSEYRHQAMADLIAFRDLFASLFFVSVGMLVAPQLITDNLGPILGILAAVLVGKAAIVFLAGLIMRMPFRVGLISALSLAQIGEFSFVLLYATQGSGLLTGSVENSLVTVATLSMFITPFLMSYGPKLAAGLGRLTRFNSMAVVESAAEASETVCRLCDHVIVAGYGFAGRELSQALIGSSVPFVVVDLNIENVRRAASEVNLAVYGDVTSEAVLNSLGIGGAKELVILINDPSASELVVRQARMMAPELFISVRTTYLLDTERLLAAGANEVIPAEREAAAQVVSQVLKRLEVGTTHIEQQVSEVRTHDESDSD